MSKKTEKNRKKDESNIKSESIMKQEYLEHTDTRFTESYFENFRKHFQILYEAFLEEKILSFSKFHFIYLQGYEEFIFLDETDKIIAYTDTCDEIYDEDILIENIENSNFNILKKRVEEIFAISTVVSRLTSEQIEEFKNEINIDEDILDSNEEISITRVIPSVILEEDCDNVIHLLEICIQKNCFPNEFIQQKETSKILQIIGDEYHFCKKYIKSININENEDILFTFVNLEEKYKNIDKGRANLDEYDENILLDSNRGHWDIFNREEMIKYMNKGRKLYSRNPEKDICSSGIIGIDFGTKSTVVVCQNQNNITLPMRISGGNLRKEVRREDYENPTIVEFKNIKEFMKDYRSTIGRPETKWKDITVSHTAFANLISGGNEQVYSIFSDLKQWAITENFSLFLKDENNYEYLLTSYMDLKEGDLDPIEIYAYYIGNYINNMRNGIFLEYHLSFPVNYEKKIRVKILDSFTKGIKKSLPPSILENKKIMKQFKVFSDVTEPAAYAICALREYGFFELESEEEKIYYGVFDFGGGTTDFDFGTWKYMDEDYDYELEHFGSGGDCYLGGENILLELSYEIFKSNKGILREKEITFVKPHWCNRFVGDELLISNSKEARLNSKKLCEVLRIFWENTKNENFYTNQEEIENIEQEEIQEEIQGEIQEEIENIEQEEIQEEIENIEQEEIQEDIETVNGDVNKIERVLKSGETIIKLPLFNMHGNIENSIDLIVDLEGIDNIIKQKIREGINSFFLSLKNAFINQEYKNIKLFLAGNSSKHPFVIQEFTEQIKQREVQMDIFPALGTEEAYKKLEALKISIDREDKSKPTGKTGVAYGIVELALGKIKVNNRNENEEEIKFKLYVGDEKRKKFRAILTPETAFHQFSYFRKLTSNTFNIYYTSKVEAIENDLGIEQTKRKRITLEIEDFENVKVYIKITSPNKIAYVLTKREIEEKEYLEEKEILLD